MTNKVSPELAGTGIVSAISESKFARRFAAGVMSVGLALGVGVESQAANSGDPQVTYNQDGNYPYRHANLVGDASESNYEIDGSVHNPAGYDYRNCTDYVWWRVFQEFGRDIAGWHDAGEWDTGAANAGYQVDKVPEIGDIAQWDPTSSTGAGRFGHVAFVEKVFADGSIDVAEYNKNSEGEFQKRIVRPSGTDRFRMPEHFIDINGPNSNDFKLKLYQEGTAAPLSVNEQRALDKHNAEVAAAKANQALFAAIPKERSIRGANGAWYIRKGNTLQWVVTGDAAAIAIGLDKKRFGADKTYTENLIHTKELGYTYPYTQRDKDYAAGKFGSRVTMTISSTQMTTVAKQLGFDSALNIVTQGAKGWRWVKAGKQYDVNMDLVAMMTTGRTDVFAYPSDWKGPTSWRAYLPQSASHRANYFQLPFADVSLASYLSVDDLPGYKTRLDYLYTAPTGAPCTTPDTVCAWGQDSTIATKVGAPYLPATVGKLTNVKDIAVAYDAPFESTTYALKQDGTVLSWGPNNFGELGNGTIGGTTYEPAIIPGLTNVKSISASFRNAYALKNDGTVWRWGSNLKSRTGSTGVVTVTDTAPTQFTELSNVTSLAITPTNGYALKGDGTVWAWGTASRGRLGNPTDRPNGTSTSTAIPVKVSGLTGVVAIAAHGMNAYALKNDGTIWAWGVRTPLDGGALGDGLETPPSADVPVRVSGLTGIVALSAPTESRAGYALKSDGTLWAWGQGANGELGDNRSGFESGTSGAGHYRTVPAKVLNLSGVTTVGASANSGFATKSDGTIWAWGANFRATLGNGPAPEVTNPQGDIATVPTRNSSFAGGRAVRGAFGAVYMIVN